MSQNVTQSQCRGASTSDVKLLSCVRKCGDAVCCCKPWKEPLFRPRKFRVSFGMHPQAPVIIHHWPVELCCDKIMFVEGALGRQGRLHS
jgi:hypothetical protein